MYIYIYVYTQTHTHTLLKIKEVLLFLYQIPKITISIYFQDAKNLRDYVNSFLQKPSDK